MSGGYPIVEFIHDARFAQFPPSVVAMAERCCLDTLGVAVAGRVTKLSRIITGYAERFHAGSADGADILFSGKTANVLGAALAGGMTIDAFDAHDGHRLTKGHAGAAVLPALVAICSSLARSGCVVPGQEFLTALAVGYEVSLRAGIALHATACDYHTSGSWNALGVAALAARLLALDTEATRHALGIAEYHGPRSQMMRCIDHPTMLKDGSGWGAMTGLSSAYLAAAGFTGAPAITLEGDNVHEYWRNLGSEWQFLAQYFKPYPVCRWAQPAVQAVHELMKSSHVSYRDITKIGITTFHQGVRLAGHAPQTTEEAQYAIAFPVAAMIVRGRLGPDEIAPAALEDPEVLAVSRRIELNESESFNRQFPAERWAEVTFTLADGRLLRSPATSAFGDPECPMSDRQIEEKFFALCEGRMPREVSTSLQKAIQCLKTDGESVEHLLHLSRYPVSAAVSS
jgi:2-methylcitrate dehydratase PrpD